MKGVPGERKTGWSGPLAKCVRNEFVRGGGWGRVCVWGGGGEFLCQAQGGQHGPKS